MEIISRKQAKELLLEEYYTGKPCKHGHVSPRATKSGDCRECVRERASKWYLNNNERALEARSTYYQNNKTKMREQARAWAANNPEAMADSAKRWRKNNPKTVLHHVRKRQNRIRMSTVLPQELEQIKQFYLNCPDGYEVDHIIPLHHPLVCGLHVLANLQYLTKAENRAKRNKWPYP